MPLWEASENPTAAQTELHLTHTAADSARRALTKQLRAVLPRSFHQQRNSTWMVLEIGGDIVDLSSDGHPHRTSWIGVRGDVGQRVALRGTTDSLTHVSHPMELRETCAVEANHECKFVSGELCDAGSDQARDERGEAAHNTDRAPAAPSVV